MKNFLPLPRLRSRPILLEIGDAHLDEAIYVNSRRPLKEDPCVAFECCVDLALRLKEIHPTLQGMVAPGDLVNRRINPAGPIAFFCRQMDRLRDADVPFFYIRGNHDNTEPPWPVVHAWPTHLHRLLYDIGSWAVIGVDNRPREHFIEDVKACVLLGLNPEKTLLVTHQSWLGWMREKTNPEADFANVPFFRHLFTGDFHHAGYRSNPIIETKTGADGQEIRVASAGGTYLRAINEPWQKYCLILCEDGTQVPVALPSRPVVGWHQILTPTDRDALVLQIRTQIAEADLKAKEQSYPLTEPLVAVQYDPSIMTEDELLTAVGDYGILMAYEMTPNEAADGAMVDADPEAGPDGEAVTLMDTLAAAEMDEPVRDLLTRLLGMPDSAAEFHAWQKERLSCGLKV